MDTNYFRTLLISIYIIASPYTHAVPSPIELTLAYQTNPAAPYALGTGPKIPKNPGIALDIIDAAAKELNLVIKYERYPNARVLHLLKNSIIDGAFLYSYKPERNILGRYPKTPQGEIDTSKRIARLSYWLYSKPGADVEWNGGVLSKANGILVAARGDSIVGVLKALGHEVTESKSDQHSLLMLSKHDTVLGAALIDIKADPFLSKPEFNRIERSELPLKSNDYFLVLSNDFVEQHPEVAEAFWQKIGDLRDKVTQQAITR